MTIEMPQVRPMTRRTMLIGAGALAALGLRPLEPRAYANEIETHGLSAYGDLRYPPDFRHVDYVNPDAPKGGILSFIGQTRANNQSFLTFNSLNSYILKGDGAQGMEWTFATLMAPSLDEPDSLYPAAARAVRIAADGRTYRFLLRQEVKFHDGAPLTAHDVVFSLTTLRTKGHPNLAQGLEGMEGAEAADDLTVVVRFATGARTLPLFVAGLPIFSRAHYAGKPFDESTVEAPLGSGPYKVGRFEIGRYIEYDRVQDWWGAELPIFRGKLNFDVLRYEFYRDRTAEFEGFTAKNYLFREELSSRIWAMRYDLPMVRDGRIKKDVVPNDSPSGGQGWIFNTRREQFKDPRAREALIDAFDFEWTNKNIMYSSYQRAPSVFQNSDLMARGMPSPDELAVLEPWRGKVPDEVFGEPYVPPVSNGSGHDRALLRRADELLRQGAWVIKDGKRVNAQGDRFTIEFLLEEPTFQPHTMPLIKNLARLGIDADVRIVDAVQYRRRLDEFDFDIVIQRANFSTTPGEALRPFFGSQAAATKGSFNLAGIREPAIDALIEKVIAADSRAELNVACRALDRLIRAGRYWIPMWYKAVHWLAYWDVYAKPATKPRYGLAVAETWWYDRDKAQKLAGAVWVTASKPPREGSFERKRKAKKSTKKKRTKSKIRQALLWALAGSVEE
jgi:microcin C transport system substrate-binding protein